MAWCTVLSLATFICLTPTVLLKPLTNDVDSDVQLIQSVGPAVLTEERTDKPKNGKAPRQTDEILREIKTILEKQDEIIRQQEEVKDKLAELESASPPGSRYPPECPPQEKRKGESNLTELTQRISRLCDETHFMDVQPIKWLVQKGKDSTGGPESVYTGTKHFVMKGYKGYLRVYFPPNGEEILVKYFLVGNGDSDSRQHWPFRLPYTLTLYHPTDAKKDVRVPKSETKFVDEVEKPQGKESLVFSQKFPMKLVEEYGYHKRNSVVIGITFHCEFY